MAEGTDPMFFDLRTVHDYFDQALVQDDDVDLKAYLDAYNELYKFFQLMGSVFSFVSSDLKLKIAILDELVKKNGTSYATIKSMIDHEKENKLMDKSDFVNGTRTLLRLHRGLDFIREFLRQLGELGDVDKTSSCCQDAYGKTLAKHHPWVIRKAAVVAMYTMPTKELLFKKNHISAVSVQMALELLDVFFHVAAIIYYLSHGRYLSEIPRLDEILSKLSDKDNVSPAINKDSDQD